MRKPQRTSGNKPQKNKAKRSVTSQKSIKRNKQRKLARCINKAYKTIKKDKVTFKMYMEAINTLTSNKKMAKMIWVDGPDADNKYGLPIILVFVGYATHANTSTTIKKEDGTYDVHDVSGEDPKIVNVKNYAPHMLWTSYDTKSTDLELSKAIQLALASQFIRTAENSGYVNGKDFYIFDGGISPKTMSPSVHMPAYALMKPDGTLRSSEELKHIVDEMFPLDPKTRRARIMEYIHELPITPLLPTSDINKLILPHVLFNLNIGSPLTPIRGMMTEIPNFDKRVVLTTCMNLVKNPAVTLFGGNFNDYSDPEASALFHKIFGGKTRIIHCTSDSFKGPNMESTIIPAMPEDSHPTHKEIQKWKKQWEDYKGGPTPAFDAVLPYTSQLLKIFEVVKASISYGSNNMPIIGDTSGPIDNESDFLPGDYTTRNVHNPEKCIFHIVILESCTV